MILMKIINEEEFDENFAENGTEELDILSENSTVFERPMSSLMKVLGKSMRILYKRCAPFVEYSFYNLVFRTMIEFQRLNAYFPDLNILAQKRILRILDKCENRKDPSFIINGTHCEDKHVVETITNLKLNLTWPHKLEPISFRWGRNDPIIEAAWSAAAFVHAFCFDFFVEDMLHYSLFVKGMNEIFIQPLVRVHW